MNVLNNISNEIKRFANKKYIIPALVLFIIMLVLMERSPIGSIELKELNAGIGMLDMQFGYSPILAYNMFEQIGSTGRELYSKLLGLDFIFSVVYMVLQSLLITALMRKTSLSARWGKLNLLPFARTVLDFAENGLLLFLLASFPAKHMATVEISSVITIVKLVINYGYIAIVFTMGALTTRQSVLSKIQKQKYKESRQAL